MNQRRFTFKSAYGQLIVMVFLPISILALIGSALVYSETSDANYNEQKALAQGLLLRYQPIIQERLPDVIRNHNHDDIHEDERAIIEINQQLSDIMFMVQADLNIHRIALIDDMGTVYHTAGYASKKPWFSLQKPLDGDFVSGLETSVGTAYGLSVGHVVNKEKKRQLWFFVDMDSQPLKIAMYRITLALVITGLLTVLLLLLTLNVYSRRWISPIYELRLQLQSINAESLSQGINLRSRGEIKALNRDLTNALHRLNSHFIELKSHAEQTEKDLNETLDEMEAQNISMRHAQKLAESSSLAKSSFLANISHELRTPLNSIDGFINLLSRNDTLSDEPKLYIETIRKSSSHLLALVNDVLDFSKIEAGKLVLDSHEYDFYAAIYDVVDMLSPLASEKGLRMGVLFYNDVPLNIVGDELRLKQVLTNLVANAIKFTDSGEVLVKISLSDNKENYLNIAIQDSGRGVSEKNQQQLFNSFNQGDPSTTRHYGGTGLGLVISKQIIHIKGGEIGFFDNHAENVASLGSTFWFDMPTNIDIDKTVTAGDIAMPNVSNIMVNNGFNKSLTNTLNANDTIKMLVWLNHKANLQLLQACLRPLNIMVTQANSLAGTLDKLKEQGNEWQWVVVDSDANEMQDDMTALLKQVRLHYQGKLSVFGYQVALDTHLLSRYKAFALHEPLDKRQLYAMLDNRAGSVNKNYPETLRWQGYRVLAVDDHLPNLLVLEALLAEQGIDVVTASNGFEAIEMIGKQNGADNKNTIDLIFMDMQMPRMSGKETSLEIRKLEKTTDRVPIIALTAQGIADEKESLMVAGIDDYVGKPISQIHLNHILQRWLPKKSFDTDNIKISPLFVDGGSVNTQLDTRIQSKDQTTGNPFTQKNRQIDNAHAEIFAESFTELLPSTAFSMVAEQQSLQKLPVSVQNTTPVSRLYTRQSLPRYLQQILKHKQGILIQKVSQLITDGSYVPVMRVLHNIPEQKGAIKEFNHPVYVHKMIDLIIYNQIIAHQLIFDWQDGLTRSANKSDLASKLVIMLIDSVSQEKHDLVNAWSTKDLSQLDQVNHRLLGASRYAGVPQLRLATQWLEDTLHLHDKSQESVDTEKIHFHYDWVIRAIDNLITLDVSPWPQLRYGRLAEDEMAWKMI